MIIDTNALSALSKGDPKLEEVLSSISQPFLPVVVLGEYRFGLMRSRHKKQIEQWLDEWVEQHFLVLEVDSDTARFYAKVREQLRTIGKPIPANDLWIAALALQHEQPIISRDIHFDSVEGITRVAW